MKNFTSPPTHIIGYVVQRTDGSIPMAGCGTSFGDDVPQPVVWQNEWAAMASADEDKLALGTYRIVPVQLAIPHVGPLTQIGWAVTQPTSKRPKLTNWAMEGGEAKVIPVFGNVSAAHKNAWDDSGYYDLIPVFAPTPPPTARRARKPHKARTRRGKARRPVTTS